MNYYEDLEEVIPSSVPFLLVPPSSKSTASLLFHPASLSHLQYQSKPVLRPSLLCFPSAPRLLLCLLHSGACINLQLCHGKWIPRVCLGAPSPSLHLSPSPTRLHLGSSLLQTGVLMAPPQSHWIYLSSLAPWLHLGRSSPRVHLGLQDLECRPVSVFPQLH